MAKILVPKTSSQLSLSFGVGGGQPGTNSIPNTSTPLRAQVFARVSEQFEKAFKPLTFAMIANVIAKSQANEVYFVGKDKKAIGLRQLIVNIADKPSPVAHVALSFGLRGPEGQLENVCQMLVRMLRMPLDVRRRVNVGSGSLTVAVTIDPVARIDVGTLSTPPLTRSFVLREEVAHLLPVLDGLDRPYTVVALGAA